MINIDLGLNNGQLYDGCRVEEVAGRKNLVTPVAEAIQIVGKNINQMVAETPADQRDKVVLTGPMAVWAYLIVFHAVVHAFTSVEYSDGKGSYLVAKHG